MSLMIIDSYALILQIKHVQDFKGVFQKEFQQCIFYLIQIFYFNKILLSLILNALFKKYLDNYILLQVIFLPKFSSY